MTTRYSYKGFEIEHTVKPRMKNIYFRITDNGKVTVSSSKISKKRVFELIDEKEAWIAKALQKVTEKPRLVLGKEILYFGESYPLEYHPQFAQLKHKCDSSAEEQIPTHYQNFYKKEAQSYLQERLNHYSVVMDLKPSEMKLRSMKRQWGNCRSNGVITFNIHLIQTPKECIDYVVVHELAHMVHMNHSKAFHALVEQYLPQSKEKRALLKSFSASL
ncbi:MAG: SprT family zinc-dependent metalloprotease [Helicobacteraceae bacterium]|nr:SprT family zinc-dependent metalloprotease [Helicobacteraceae bacterium]